MDTLTQLRAVSQQIEDQRALIDLRDQLIVQARDAGVAWGQIAEATGMAVQSVRNIGQRKKRP